MKSKLQLLNTILLLGLVFCTSVWATKIDNKKSTKEEGIDQSWLAQAMANIEKDEYQIHNIDGINSSINNAQNLKFNYSNIGFSVSPLELGISDKEIKNWKADFTTIGFGHGNKIEYYFNGEIFSSQLNEASISDKNLEVKYLNNKKGMRQDFIVKKKPTNKKGLLTLRFNINTEENIVVGANALIFKDSENILMKYNELKVWDANGEELRGWFESIDNSVNKTEKQFAIKVNDKNATYPITIDPISTTADWSKAGENAGDEFGTCVATAGDVNGDGRSDILIGAPYYDNGESNEGKVYLFYGGVAGPSTTADWSFENNSASSNLGISVATAGDMNGDGYSDIIVGAYGYNGLQGKIYIFLSDGSSGLPASTSVTFEGSANSGFGYAVSPAGDFNGDGYSDVLVGAPFYTDGSTDEEGIAYVFYGAATENDILNGTAWSAEGNSTNMNFGQSVNFAGDIDKDGYSDIIVGAPMYDDGTIGSDVGKVFVFHGGANPSTTAEAENLGQAAGDQFGYSVSTAGDVNGDGYSDVIVGAPYFEFDSATNGGCVYVFYGSASTISASYDWRRYGAAGNHQGNSVASAGDINGDGYGDIVFGIEDYTAGTNDIGYARAYFGSSTGLPSASDWARSENDLGSSYGHSVATAGDVNGDGYSDIIIGAYKEDVSGTDDGKAYLYFGSPSGVSSSANWNKVAENSSIKFGQGLASAGDVNGDGYSDVIIGDPNYNSSQGRVYLFIGTSSGLGATATWIEDGEATNQSFGYSVATAGDVNGDGYSDVIIGAPEFETDGSSTDEGKVYVYYGSSSSPYLSSTADWSFESDEAGNKLGFSVSSAGDVNGDGYSDIIYGIPYYTGGQSNEGAFIVNHGSSSGISGGTIIESNVANANLGYSVSFAGDVNGDVFSDVVVGAPFYTNTENNEGKVFVHVGSTTGISSSASWGYEPNIASAQVGISVACAGDVNADGLTDIIVGANGGDLALVLYGDNSTTINPTYTTLTGTSSSAFGTSVSSAGDVDGNGYSDVIVGAPLYNTDEGAAYLYQSDKNGLNTTADWSISGSTGDEYGTMVAVAGDVDGNGYSDVLTFAPNVSGGSEVYSFYGNESRNGKTPDISQTIPTAPYTIISSGGLSSTDGSVMVARTFLYPIGKSETSTVYEFGTENSSFSSGSSISNGVGYTGKSAYTTSENFGVSVSGLATDHEYNWRIRAQYNPVSSPYITYGPWRYYKIYMPAPWGGVKPQTTPVPVELTTFTATSISSTTVVLNWQTTTEINNYGFEVQRAVSSNQMSEKEWKTISFVDGHGNSNSPNEYSFVDTDKLSGTVSYRLKQLDFDGGFEYHDVVTIELDSNLKYKLAQNNPNPFNPSTQISFTIPKVGVVKLNVYNMLGEKVAELLNENISAGYHQVNFDASHLSSGIYFYKISTGNFVDVKKMMLIK